MEIPNTGRIMLYGPLMINVEALVVQPDEYEQLPELRKYMLDLMRRYKGVGIAAPQVGVFSQFFVMETEEGGLLDFVNPRIVKMFGFEKEGFEACLSLPPSGNGCEVPRMEHITVVAGTSADPHSQKVHDLSGMNAVIAQHEIDHLWGVFFVDRVSSAKRKLVLDLYKKWKDQKDKSLIQKEDSSAKNNSRSQSSIAYPGGLPHVR